MIVPCQKDGRHADGTSVVMFATAEDDVQKNAHNAKRREDENFPR